MGPLINYREERANARDEREGFISGRNYRRQDDADGIITRPKSYSWVKYSVYSIKSNNPTPEGWGKIIKLGFWHPNKPQALDDSKNMRKITNIYEKI